MVPSDSTVFHVNDRTEREGITTPKPAVPWLALALALALCLFYLASELYVFERPVLPLDDSWIHLQFARNLAAGEGLSFQDGRWMPASTAPLWTALLSLGFVLPGAGLPGAAVAWAKILGVACFLGTVLATDRLAAELGLGAATRQLAAVLTAATHWLVWSALSGMEVTLFAFLSLWGIVLHLRERAEPQRLPLSLAVLAAATLARPEGSLLLLLALAERCVRFETTPSGLRMAPALPRPTLLTGAAAAVVVVLPTWTFYRLAGDSFFPTTYAVKASADLVPSGAYLRIVLDILFRSQPIMLLAAGAGILHLVARLGGQRDRGLLPALWPVGLALAYSLLASPSAPPPVGNFGRYWFPILPVIVVLGVLGVEEAGRRLGRPLRALAVVALLAPQLWGLATGHGHYLKTLANVEDSDVAAARWLAPRLPPEALLAVQDIGALKYHLPNRVIDLAGIATPEVLPVLRGSGPQDPIYWEQRLVSFLEQRKPDYLVVFPRSYPRITGGAPGFEKIQSFPVEDNVTMAGDELAIFSTPWTGHRLRKPSR